MSAHVYAEALGHSHRSAVPKLPRTAASLVGMKMLGKLRRFLRKPFHSKLVEEVEGMILQAVV